MPSQDVAPFGSLQLPPDTSSLTATPTEDLTQLPWTTLHTLPTTASAAAFWHTISDFTTTQHWNRTIYQTTVTTEELVNLSTFETKSPPELIPRSFPYRYNAVRHLARKTPAPVGPDDRPCYDAHEWTSQYVVPPFQHIAVFALCVPNLVTKHSPRALRYWPFQYPKVRAYRFVYNILPEVASDGALAELRYDVVPLGDEACNARQFEQLKIHSVNGAKKMLTVLRKRMVSYNPETGLSTYVKRVHHDNLISELEYRRRYDAMKLKYSFWVAQWTEVTDPTKFVYEELSIAAYLCALWERERKEEGLDRLQTFIDCGCGNGFLVYLLISEGHSGIGVDLQRRHIWDKYPPHVTAALKYEEMDPCTYDVSSYDWILGNHSDELSPWIPVMASRCQKAIDKRPVCKPSGETFGKDVPKSTLRRAYPRFFVLPCCFFDFDGKKVCFGLTRRTLGVRTVAGTGKYEQYYRWIGQIARAFGFTVEIENLRIPSTKYVSLLGRFIEFEERTTPEVIKEMTSLLLLDATQSHI